MPLWGKTDAAGSSPKWAGALNKKAANSANRTAAFGNTSIGMTGVFGVDAAESVAALNDGKIAHTGWNARRFGTGPITSVAITAAGSGYANTDTFVVNSAGGTNAAGTITTNGNGAITAVALTNRGAGFRTVTTAATITTSGGTAATLTATAGGRAGRVHFETLVAMGPVTSDASDDTQLPDS